MKEDSTLIKALKIIFRKRTIVSILFVLVVFFIKEATAISYGEVLGATISNELEQTKSGPISTLLKLAKIFLCNGDLYILLVNLALIFVFIILFILEKKPEYTKVGLILITISFVFLIYFMKLQITEYKKNQEAIKLKTEIIDNPKTPSEEQKPTLSKVQLEMIKLRQDYFEEFEILINKGENLKSKETYYAEIKSWQDEVLPQLEEYCKRFRTMDYPKFAHYCCNDFNAIGKKVNQYANEDDQNLFDANRNKTIYDVGLFHVKNIGVLKEIQGDLRNAIREVERNEIITREDIGK